jgi:hypothetical protein
VVSLMTETIEAIYPLFHERTSPERDAPSR